MEILEFNREYVIRTKEIIEHLSENFECEVTLLINCLNGLVTLPTVQTGNSDQEFQKRCVSKLRDMGVIARGNDEKKIFRAVKNAVSHMYIEPVNQERRICGIIIRDKMPHASEFHTELIFSPDQLKEYALFIADLHLQRYVI